MKHQPPKRALKFLRWFCREDYIDELEGDLTELFRKEAVASPAAARRKFTWRVLRCFRPAFMKSFRSSYNPTIMFRHNLLITYRSFLRYKSSFFINLIGLSSGLACALLIFLWVNDELHIDRFHSERLYQVLENVKQDDRIITRYSTSGPMASTLEQEMPEVEMAITSTQSWIRDFVLTIDDNNLKAEGVYADSAFFRMFNFPLLMGDARHALSDKYSLVLSESLAGSLFGSAEAAIGKMVQLQHKDQFKVSGVMEDVPRLSSTRFDFVMSFQIFRDDKDNDWVTGWDSTAPQTFVLLRPGTDVRAFNARIADMVRVKTGGRANHRTPFIQRFGDTYLYNRYENGVLAGGRIDYVRMFSLIAAFILFIACINFMNLATARASRRSKEVGIKKAVGARRGALVFQYFSESTLMTLLSLVVAVAIVWLLLPQFNVMTGKNLGFQLDTGLVMMLAGMALVTGFVSGSYPALYLSRFKPVAVLKGRTGNLFGEAWARKGLVVFQFIISIALIVSVWVVYLQIRFTQTRNLGYDKDNILIMGQEGGLIQKLEAFLAEVTKVPGVVAASASSHDMTGHNGGSSGVVWPGKDPDDRTEFERFGCNYGLIELLGMKMKAGRSFSRAYGAEEGKIIFNEAGIAFMGMDDPIGRHVTLWGRDMEIIGVVQDFNFESFHERVKPAMFFLQAPFTGNIMIRIQHGRERETIALLAGLYDEFNPGFPMNYRFLDEDYQTLYAAEGRVATLSKYFAGLAVIISCLGLFGLAAFTAERRTKEIGIRKILGASTAGIVYLLTGDFTKMVVFAIVVALPLSYYMADTWLKTFVFHFDLTWWLFAGSGVAALVIAWFTVSFQTLRAAYVNPVECLKDE